jgi:hypothetical protein
VNAREARDAIAALVRPLGYAELMAALHRGAAVPIPGGCAEPAALLGPDPAALLLSAYGRLAEPLTYHAVSPAGPPPADVPDSDAAFRERVATLHALGYSVRFPTLRPLSPALDRMARALETVLHQPVTASAFWSRGPLSAPVHYDEHDILAVQLRGTKTWRIARGPSALCTTWKGIPGALPVLGGDPFVVTVAPGDVIYLPRGLPHTVDADADSIHVALGFTPLTLRDAVIAMLDELTERERALRDTLIGDLDEAHARGALEQVRPRAMEAVAALHRAAGTPGFLDQALRRRSARAVGDLAAAETKPAGAIGLDTTLRRRPLAFCHLSANADMIDVAYPGGHLYVHRGAGRSVAFVAAQDAFCPRDLPDELDEAVRIALIRRFVDVGILEVVPQ